MKVAELFGVLGLKIDNAAWNKGSAAIENVRKGLNKIGSAAKSAYTTIVAGLLGGGMVALSDSYTNLENRIKQVSSSQSEMESLMDRTRAIANATRSDWGATGEAFVRLKNATKDLNLSTSDQLDLVTTLNMALQASGASASEAAAGTLQLMQGLASGALQGDEFRSIAEQLPDLMDVFAKELKVSRGELKKLGAEGKITSAIVVSALQNSAAAFRDKFVGATATAGQGWVVLKNNMMLAAAEIVRTTGIVDGMGTAVRAITSWIEGNRDNIREYAALVGSAISTAAAIAAAAFGAVGKVVSWFRAASDEALAVLIAIGSVIVIAVVPALWAMAAGWVAALAPILLVIAAIAAVAYGVIKLVKHWDKIKVAAGRAWDWIKEKIWGFVGWLGSIATRVGNAIAAPFIAAYDFVKDLLVGLVNFFIRQINWLIDKINWVAKKANKLPGIDLGTISKIDMVGAPQAPALSVPGAAAQQTTTNTMSVSMTIDGSKDPKATAQEVQRHLGQSWGRITRQAEGG